MSEAQIDEKPQPLPPVKEKTPPSRTSPSPDEKDAELKLSRKREREVSLEPLTPSANGELDLSVRERKDSRAPVKKNRRRLDPTEEEEEGGSGSRSGSNTPPPTTTVLTSPRQQRNLRQIRKGVRNISWKNPDASTADGDADVEIEEDQLDVTPPDSREGSNTLAPAAEIEEPSIEDDSPPKTPEVSQLSLPSQETQDFEVAMEADADASEATTRLRAGSESNGDKSLKRKFLERGTSQGPPETRDPKSTEPLKRPRDEAETDDNPRETKRPSPPPSPKVPSSGSPKIPKQSGFMAYASASSPFGAVKGSNIFKSSSTSPSPFSPSPTPAGPLPEFTSVPGQSSNATPNATKLSGFEAFASSTSPFGSLVRTKSPVLGQTSKFGRAKSPPPRRAAPAFASNPFGSYAGSSQTFGVPAQKRVRANSPDGASRSSFDTHPKSNVFNESATGSANGSDSGDDNGEEPTFSELLRAERDSDGEVNAFKNKRETRAPEVTLTGEEEEETIHQARGKLFSFTGGVWKERGTGILKINIKHDGNGARLVMRKDAVHTLLLNAPLFAGMNCELMNDPRYLRINAIENGVPAIYNFKVANQDIAADLLDEIKTNIPQ